MAAQQYIVRVLRGLKANLPAEEQLGRVLFTTDTHEFFIGEGIGHPVVPLEIDQAYVKNLIADLLLKADVSYVDTQDAVILAAAKAYTDAHVPSGLASVTYVDAQDAATLAAAEAYTDSHVPSGTATVVYVDAQDAATLATAEGYTDTKISAEVIRANAAYDPAGAAATAQSTAEGYAAGIVATEAGTRASGDSARQLLSEKGQPNGYVALDANSLIPNAYLPPLAITKPNVVGSQAAMLALVAEEGDVAIRTDINKNFILKAGGDPTALADWLELLTPAAPVQTVNGQTGTVLLILASSITGSSHKWLHSYDAASGTFSETQPDFADLTNPPLTFAGSSYSGLNFRSGDGIVNLEDDGMGNISASLITPLNSLDFAQFNNGDDILTASRKTDVAPTGTFIDFKDATNSVHLFKVDITGTLTNGIVPVARVSGLTAIATSGKWSDLVAATADLTLAQTTRNTTFTHTAATNWIWSNITAAVAGGTNQSSPILNINGRYFQDGADALDGWSFQNVIAASKSFAVTNAAETAGFTVTLTVTGHNFVVGDVVTFTSLTQAAWLNGQHATVVTAPANTITFVDPTSHGLLNSVACTGTATQSNPKAQLVITHTGSVVPQIVIPTGLAPTATQATAPITGSSQNAGWGFGPGTAGSGAILTFMPSGGAQTHLKCIQGGIAHFNLQTADNSQGNQMVYVDCGAIQSGFTFKHAYTTINRSAGTQGSAGFSFGGSSNNIGPATNIAGDHTLMALGIVGSGMPNPSTFIPVYGTGNYQSLFINPTINQALISGTIAGVQVVTNVVTVVFSTTAAFTNGATNLVITAGTNTAVNGSQTVTGSVARVNVTITNITESAGNLVTLACSGNANVTNDYVYLTGLTVGTWLNGKVVKLSGTNNATQMQFTDPTSHGTQASTAETGTVTCNYVTYAKTTGNITLTTDTGTATQQGLGVYTNILVNNVETALSPGPHYFLDFQAGAAGTTRKFAVTNTGTIVGSGGQSASFVSKSGNYTLTVDDFAVQFTATATATLPASQVTGKVFRLKCKAGTLTITPASGLIDDAASVSINTVNQSIDVMYDGTNWQIF
jgi:hypothetical protein